MEGVDWMLMSFLEMLMQEKMEYEKSYKQEAAKARRWNELVARHGNNRKKILEIMAREGYNVWNYRSFSGKYDDNSA